MLTGDEYISMASTASSLALADHNGNKMPAYDILAPFDNPKVCVM